MPNLKEQLLELIMLDIRYFRADNEPNFAPQLQLNPEIIKFLKEYPIGGIILFKENLSDQITKLTTALQDDIRLYPRFIAIDEEGGVVSRIGLETIGNMALGTIDDVSITANNAKIIARELKQLGINFNLAPVVDINSNPDNPIIGVRAFGSDADLVAKHAVAFTLGLNSEGVIACAKHFPGHGDTNADTHLGDALLNKSYPELKACELVPYVNLVKSGQIDAIMTAHIMVPQIDSSQIEERNGKNFARVASMSRVILSDILRNELGFTGVVITDALDMKAISANFTPLLASTECIKAGADILLMPIRIWDKEGIESFKTYFADLMQACSDDIELTSQVNESYNRVIKLKQKYLCLDSNVINLDSNRSKTVTNYGESKSINGYDRVLQLELAKLAITTERNTNLNLPFNFSQLNRVLFISNNSKLLETAVVIANNIISKLVFKLEVDFIVVGTGLSNESEINSKINNASHVITLTRNLSAYSKELNQIFVALNKLKKPYTNISCQNPYDIRFIPDVTTNLLIYGVSGFDQTNYIQNNFTLNLEAALEKVLCNYKIKS